jgi:hypothetical protein
VNPEEDLAHILAEYPNLSDEEVVQLVRDDVLSRRVRDPEALGTVVGRDVVDRVSPVDKRGDCRTRSRNITRTALREVGAGRRKQRNAARSALREIVQAAREVEEEDAASEHAAATSRSGLDRSAASRRPHVRCLQPAGG